LGDGELDAERSRRRTVIGTAALAEINDAHQPKRSQRGIIEVSVAPDVAYPEGNMVQHMPPPFE
jgi:hypothetical protein